MRGQFLPQLAVNKKKGTGPEEKLLPWLMLLQLLVGIALKGEKLLQLRGTGSTYIIVKSVVEIFYDDM